MLCADRRPNSSCLDAGLHHPLIILVGKPIGSGDTFMFAEENRLLERTSFML